MIRAVVFDFDGLILDTETSSFETAVQWSVAAAAHTFALAARRSNGGKTNSGAQGCHRVVVLCEERGFSATISSHRLIRFEMCPSLRSRNDAAAVRVAADHERPGTQLGLLELLDRGEEGVQVEVRDDHRASA